MEAASREKTRVCLTRAPAALAPSPSSCAQAAGTRHGPQMAKRVTKTWTTHVVLSLHASSCQLQHLGVGKEKQEDGCTDQLNCKNPPHDSKAKGLTRFLCPFPYLTQCCLLFLTPVLGGTLECPEGKGRIDHTKNTCTLTRGHTETRRHRICAPSTRVRLVK